MALTTEKYRKLFLVEADEKITDLNRALMGLEKKPGDLDLANNAMRAAHTIKSSAAAMNFMGISHLAHAMEDLFEQVRSKKHQLEPGAVNLLFEAVDTLSSSIKAIKQDKPELKTAKMIEKLNEISNFKFQISKNNNKSEILNLKSEIIEPIEAIKVDVAVLDKLMNLTEELLVERMRLNELVSSIKYQVSSIKQGGKESLIHNTKYLIQEDIVKIDDLSASNENIGRLLSDLQYNVVQARMVPLGQIFERFPRMVRDLAKEQKKEVDFEMRGQEIELDRTIIDRLGEPLIHLLRNAVDHGIPATSAGRQDKGTIVLSAERERDKVLIKVENDGNSIDWESVIGVAVRKGIISGANGEEYMKSIKYKVSSIKQEKNEYLIHDTKYLIPNEIENLLYLGQISTSEKVTEVSGRGVGLSIVKSVIESFGGRVFIESPADNGGTRFTLTLPLTLAIIQALLVRVANQTFALPFSQIDRSVRVSISNIKKAFDQEVAVVEEEDIPMVRLAHLFDVGKREGLFFTEEELQETKHQLQAELMVITKRNEKQAGLSTDLSATALATAEASAKVGIVIDELISEQDIVVKPLKGILKKSKGFAGVTLLGDGRPALILDVATLL